MACVDRELGYAGLKSYAWTQTGTPFVVLLFSLAPARLAAVIEADKLGQLRTGAASGDRGSPARARGRLEPGRDRLRLAGCFADRLASGRRCRRSSRSPSTAATRSGWLSFAARTAARRPGRTARRPTTTSSSPSRPRRTRCCAANGCATARSCARSAPTTPLAASSTTPCSSGPRSSAATRASSRCSSPAT